MLTQYRQKAEIKEKETLFSKAAFSANHSRYQGAENDHRLPYKRDVDRILHSKAYSRYVDKTQVVYLVENDHITHRSLHVQLVSNFARGIAEILRLNLDLVEAISLGHDVGHPPFGHEGEEYLSKLCQEHGVGAFAHPLQSCRLFSAIEPLNLGLAVYDGFLCHDGGMSGTELRPAYGKIWDDHFGDRQKKKSHPETNIFPGTLEGCLVKICDTVSYLGKDVEDAINLKIIDRQAIPKTCLGDSNRSILTHVAQDIISCSYEQDSIRLSEETYQALRLLRKFNFENIYKDPRLKVESKKIEASYRYLFENLLQDHLKNGKNSFLWTHYLHNKPETEPLQAVIDYISGMTDSYFIRTVQKILVPAPIQL